MRSFRSKYTAASTISYSFFRDTSRHILLFVVVVGGGVLFLFVCFLSVRISYSFVFSRHILLFVVIGGGGVFFFFVFFIS